MPTEEADVEAPARNLPKTNVLREDTALERYTSEQVEYDDSFVPDLDAFYTYADYLRMELKGRWELVKGFLRKMSAPRDAHQGAVSILHGTLFPLLRRGECVLRMAPYDVRLFVDIADRDTTVLQPDICVICDRSKITVRGCKGAPDLCIEVLSPSTESHDRYTKTALYEQASVREYWIVDLKRERLEQRVLQDDGMYPLPTLYRRGDTAESAVVAGFRVSVEELMDEAKEVEAGSVE